VALVALCLKLLRPRWHGRLVSRHMALVGPLQNLAHCLQHVQNELLGTGPVEQLISQPALVAAGWECPGERLLFASAASEREVPLMPTLAVCTSCLGFWLV
jgi:hypothetical protein